MVKIKNSLKTLCRGSLIKISFDPIIGHEQSGFRPALVISDISFHVATGFALCVPITSKKKGLLFEIEINGDSIKGVALIHGVRMLDLQTREFIFIENASSEVVDKAQNLLLKVVME